MGVLCPLTMSFSAWWRLPTTPAICYRLARVKLVALHEDFAVRFEDAEIIARLIARQKVGADSRRRRARGPDGIWPSAPASAGRAGARGEHRTVRPQNGRADLARRVVDEVAVVVRDAAGVPAAREGFITHSTRTRLQGLSSAVVAEADQLLFSFSGLARQDRPCRPDARSKARRAARPRQRGARPAKLSSELTPLLALQ